MDMPGAIATVIAGEDLSRQDMTSVMELIMTGGATPAQIGGFLVGLRVKGETIEEIVAAANVMRKLATPVTVDKDNLVDTCGTGGSGSSKFNVSTASAFVAGAAGARVAKHGNRAASGKSGSADVLEAAGANINLDPDDVARCIETVGVGFLFALNHHGAMKHAIGPRREMAVRTIFNMLGPLTNPAKAERQLLGVYDAALVVPVASVLKELGSQHVMVVHSDDGLDEISVSAATQVAELKDGVISEYEISPDDYDISRVSLDSLRVNDSNESLNMLKDALSGSNAGASDIVTLNAGAAIYVSGIAQSMDAGINKAREMVDSGLAEEALQRFVDFTSQLSEPT